jgi:hypothetical protein
VVAGVEGVVGAFPGLVDVEDEPHADNMAVTTRPRPTPNTLLRIERRLADISFPFLLIRPAAGSGQNYGR